MKQIWGYAQKLMQLNKKGKQDVTKLGLLITSVFFAGCIWSGLPEPETITLQAKQIITPTPTPQVLGQAVEAGGLEDEIKEVFGEHADKAFLILKGRGEGTCAENIDLDPKAKNRNWIKGQPGKYSSTDWGVFQINDHWQGVTNTKFLLDPSINIRMAWRIFEDNGYTFKMWTCGKAWGV